MVELRDYIDGKGREPFAAWFEELDAVTSARISISLRRLGTGNFSNVKGVGAGVMECRVDFGPGYRVYFGKDGDRLVILLGEDRRTTSRKTLPPRKNDGWTTRGGRNRS